MPDKELRREEFEKWINSEICPVHLLDFVESAAWKGSQFGYAAASGEALRWIPVSERVPQNSDGVVVEYVTSGETDVYVAHYFAGTGWFWADDTPVTKALITRWRSIPWPDSRPSTE